MSLNVSSNYVIIATGNIWSTEHAAREKITDQIAGRQNTGHEFDNTVHEIVRSENDRKWLVLILG